MNAELEIQKKRILVKGAKAPLFVRIMLSVVIAICVLLPVTATVVILAMGKGPHIGLLISFLVFGLMAFYLLRVLLWNSFGKEEIALENDAVRYLADYKYFKDGRREVPVSGIFIEWVQDSAGDNGKIIVGNQDEDFRTAIPLTAKQFNQVEEKILKHYGLNQSVF